MIIIKESKNYRKYQEAFQNSFLNISNLEENVPNNKDEIIQSILDNDFDTNKNNFKASLDTSLKRPYGIVLSSYSIDELSKMKTFKVWGIASGYALKKKDGFSNGLDIVSVHNSSGIKQLGELLIKSAIKNGGKYLDCFDGFLTNFYKKLGFVEYDRDSYNPKHDPGGKIKKALGGERDVIYMKLR